MVSRFFTLLKPTLQQALAEKQLKSIGTAVIMLLLNGMKSQII